MFYFVKRLCVIISAAVHRRPRIMLFNLAVIALALTVGSFLQKSTD